MCDAGGGLVEAEDARIEHEQGAELHDAPGAGRELGTEPVGVAAEAEEGDDLVGFGTLTAIDTEPAGQEQRGGDEPGAVTRFERDLQRLAHREVAEEPRRLEGSAEPDAAPALGRQPGDVVAEQFDATAGRQEAADRVHERGLARAVGTDEADHLARTRPGSQRRRRQPGRRSERSHRRS